jgi:hypothetical protein
MLYRADTCSSIQIHKVAVWSQMIYDKWRYLNFAKSVLNYTQSWAGGWGLGICYIHVHFVSAPNVHILPVPSWSLSARKANLGRDNNARIRSLRIEIDELTRMCSQNNLNKFAKKLYKNTSPMKWKYFLHWRHAFTANDFQMHQQSLGSLVLQTRKLASKTEQFWKCDDFSGEISQLTDIQSSGLCCFVCRKQWIVHMKIASVRIPSNITYFLVDKSQSYFVLCLLFQLRHSVFSVWSMRLLSLVGIDVFHQN